MLTTEPTDDPDLDGSRADSQQEPDDLDPRNWLTRDESDVVGRVSVRGGTLKVGALTQGEIEKLRRRSEKPDPRNRSKMIQDDGLFNRWVIAFALSKANKSVGTPDEILPESLLGKLSGEMAELARKILRLSGFIREDERAEDDAPFD